MRVTIIHKYLFYFLIYLTKYYLNWSGIYEIFFSYSDIYMHLNLT